MDPIYIDISPILSNLQIEDRYGAAVGRVDHVPVSVLQDAPRADVAPVVRAHWRRSGTLYICDGEKGCGFCMPEEQWYNAHFACPACGARMFEEEKK